MSDHRRAHRLSRSGPERVPTEGAQCGPTTGRAQRALTGALYGLLMGLSVHNAAHADGLHRPTGPTGRKAQQSGLSQYENAARSTQLTPEPLRVHKAEHQRGCTKPLGLTTAIGPIGCTTEKAQRAGQWASPQSPTVGLSGRVRDGAPREKGCTKPQRVHKAISYRPPIRGPPKGRRPEGPNSGPHEPLRAHAHKASEPTQASEREGAQRRTIAW